MPPPRKPRAVKKVTAPAPAVPPPIATESNNVVCIPGFEAQTIDYTPLTASLTFTSSAGRKVLVRLDDNGYAQWCHFTGKQWGNGRR